MSEQTSMKHVKDTTGVIFRIQHDPKNIRTMLVLEWADDGFGNWHWEQQETVHFPFAGVADAMWNSLQECPDPSAKDKEPPFWPGDIVKVVGPDWPHLAEKAFKVFAIHKDGPRNWWVDLVDESQHPTVRYPHAVADLKLLSRGGQ